MTPNLKATLGAIPAGRLSVNAIFLTTPCSRTGLEAASLGTHRASAKKILALTSASNILGTYAWNADRDDIENGAKALSAEALKDAGKGVPDWLSCLDPIRASSP